MAKMDKGMLEQRSRWSWSCDVDTPENGVRTRVYVTRGEGKGPYSCLLAFMHPEVRESESESLFVGRFGSLDELVDEVNGILASLATAQPKNVFKYW